MRFFRRISTLNGWQRFGFEVAIIAVGVGITLFADQLITNADRRSETRQAMQAVESDLMTLLYFTSERLVAEPCRREQVEVLAKRLEQSQGDWVPALPEGIEHDQLFGQVLPWVVRTPYRPWPTNAWDTLVMSDAALHVDRAKFQQLSGIFDTVERNRRLQDEAFRMKGRLAQLGIAGPLDGTARRESYATLGELAATEGLLAMTARQVRDQILEIDYEFADRFGPVSDLPEAEFRAILEQGWEAYGDCANLSEFRPLVDHYNTLLGRDFALSAAAGD